MYDCYIVTNQEIDISQFPDLFLEIYNLHTSDGHKKGWALLNEFGTKKTPFICVKYKGTVVKCFYADNLESPIDSFINWHFFNNMENTEVIKQVENHLDYSRVLFACFCLRNTVRNAQRLALVYVPSRLSDHDTVCRYRRRDRLAGSVAAGIG